MKTRRRYPRNWTAKKRRRWLNSLTQEARDWYEYRRLMRAAAKSPESARIEVWGTVIEVPV